MIIKEHNDFFNTKSIILEKKDEKDKDKLSDKTQKVIDDIISKKNPNLINKTKFNLINNFFFIEIIFRFTYNRFWKFIQ